MNSLFLLSLLALSSVSFLLVCPHMVPQDRLSKLSTNRCSSSSLQCLTAQSEAPPIVIVELPKAKKKNKKAKKVKKNKFNVKKKRPPPPANCVPLWASCKTPNNVCCEYCAFCQCRLFKTVCFCRMGNPRC